MADNFDTKTLFKIGCGLYVLTTNDGKKDNGMIINTPMQMSSSPLRIALSINKANYSHDVVKETGIMNINCLTEDTPFDVFKQFGFQSGRDSDKFSGQEITHSANGLAVIDKYSNAYISLKVVEYTDLGSHGMFLCEVTDGKVLNDKPTVTYDYYHKNIKPAKKPTAKKGFICKICGYIYEGDELPEDFICPICKHPASDFERIGEDVKMKKYVCKICGYVYEGESLPDDFVCPLCGQPASEFELVEDTAEKSEKSKGFKCKICGYIYEGDVLPDDYVCPVCGQPASAFEPL